MSHNLLKIFGAIFCCFAIFAIVIIVLFNVVKSNPIDKIAMTYIWNSHEISNEIGKVTHVGKNIIKKTTKENDEMTIPYLVETSNGNNTVFITLDKINGTWIVTSFNIENRR